MSIKISRNDLAQIVGARISKIIDSKIEAIQQEIRAKSEECLFENKVSAARKRLRGKKKIKDLMTALKAAGVEFALTENSVVDERRCELIVKEHLDVHFTMSETIKLTPAEIQKCEDRECEISELRNRERYLERKKYDIICNNEEISNYISEMVIAKDPELEKLISSIESRIEADLTNGK